MSWIRDWWRGREDEESDDLERMVLQASELHGVPPKQVIKTVFEDEDEYDEDELLDDDDEDEDRPRSKVAMFASFAFIGLVFGGAIVALMWLSKQSDKAGPSANSGVQQVAKSIKPTPAAVPTLLGLDFLFSYPAVFNNVQNMPASGVTAEQYMIGSSADYHRSISVLVDNFGDLPHDPSYLYRSKDTTDYAPENVKVEGEPAVIMVKHDGTEQTLFWAHGSHVITISVDSNNGTDNLTNYMNVIQPSLRWRPVSR